MVITTCNWDVDPWFIHCLSMVVIHILCFRGSDFILLEFDTSNLQQNSSCCRMPGFVIRWCRNVATSWPPSWRKNKRSSIRSTSRWCLALFILGWVWDGMGILGEPGVNIFGRREVVFSGSNVKTCAKSCLGIRRFGELWELPVLVLPGLVQWYHFRPCKNSTSRKKKSKGNQNKNTNDTIYWFMRVSTSQFPGDHWCQYCDASTPVSFEMWFGSIQIYSVTFMHLFAVEAGGVPGPPLQGADSFKSPSRALAVTKGTQMPCKKEPLSTSIHYSHLYIHYHVCGFVVISVTSLFSLPTSPHSIHNIPQSTSMTPLTAQEMEAVKLQEPVLFWAEQPQPIRAIPTFCVSTSFHGRIDVCLCAFISHYSCVVYLQVLTRNLWLLPVVSI